MDAPPTGAIGIFAKLARWIREFIAMPDRVKLLAEIARQAADPRPTCTSCGTGRVAVTGFQMIPNSGRRVFEGTCGSCGQRWFVKEDGSAVIRPIFN